VGLCPECSELQSNRLSQKINSHMDGYPLTLSG
jgi:hypothetical protein